MFIEMMKVVVETLDLLWKTTFFDESLLVLSTVKGERKISRNNNVLNLERGNLNGGGAYNFN